MYPGPATISQISTAAAAPAEVAKVKIEAKSKTKNDHGDDKETKSESEIHGDVQGTPYLGVKSVKMIAASCP